MLQLKRIRENAPWQYKNGCLVYGV
jgi:hypothetical protein